MVRAHGPNPPIDYNFRREIDHVYFIVVQWRFNSSSVVSKRISTWPMAKRDQRVAGYPNVPGSGTRDSIQDIPAE